MTSGWPMIRQHRSIFYPSYVALNAASSVEKKSHPILDGKAQRKMGRN